ncbi:MAG: hypothetical protein U9N36_10460 [Euryarchaeota archaeon]|nr:hypothetical protein [Euryarchaeota archaeon]
MEPMEEIICSLEANDNKVFEAVMGILSECMVNEKIIYNYLNGEIKFLVRKNIIFADSASKELIPQSQLTLSVMRDVMRDA